MWRWLRPVDGRPTSTVALFDRWPGPEERRDVTWSSPRSRNTVATVVLEPTLPTSCAVCLTPRSEMNRVGGLDVCDVCFHGGAAAAVAPRGWQLRSDTSVFRTKDHTYYTTTTVGVLEQGSPIRATIRLRQGLWVLMSWFGGIKVADPLFNRMLYVTSATTPATRRFLESEGAQSAVMDLAGERGRIDIDGGVVRVVVALTDEQPDEARLESEVAVLMAHLGTFAEIA